MFWNEENRQVFSGITMSSILFCKHGGIITAKTSGQRIWTSEVFAVACATTGGPTGGLTTAQEEANARYIYNFFKAQGWTTEAICGLLGNMQKECGLNPGKWQYWEYTDLGYGLLQWSPSEEYISFVGISHKSKLNEMAKNSPQELMDSQLDYIMQSLGNGENGVMQRWYENLAPIYLKKKSFVGEVPSNMTVEDYKESKCNSGDLALVFHASYERSGDGEKELNIRVEAAERWYRYFKE